MMFPSPKCIMPGTVVSGIMHYTHNYYTREKEGQNESWNFILRRL